MGGTALQGLKVADFSQGVAGPHAGLILAFQGAEVIKVEPLEGDWARRLGRSYGDFSAYSMFYNRGKRSLSIDLKAEHGREIARKLIAQSDVVIEAFRPGVMDRLGLGYGAMKALNPKLVYLSISGFGQDGPNVDLPATDAVIQGYAGIMSLNRDAEGVPRRFPMVVADVVTGLYGAQAVMAALIRRFRSMAEGEHLDINLMHCATALQATSIVEGHFEGRRKGPMYVPLGVLPTKDWFISISVMRQAHFAKLCEAMDRPDLAEDPRFASDVLRVANEAPLMEILRQEFQLRTTAEWIERLTTEGVLHAIVRSHEQLLADPETERAGFIEWVETGELNGPVPLPRLPGNRTRTEAHFACPHIGQHTAEILEDLGYARAEIQMMAASHTVRLGQPS